MRKNMLMAALVAFCLQAMLACTCRHDRAYYTDWAVRIADSEMEHNPQLWMADFVKKPKWDYTQGLIAKAILQVYDVTGNPVYLDYVTEFADYFIDTLGTIKTYKLRDYNIDRVNGGIFLYDLSKYVPKPQYGMAIDTLRSQLATQPRVSEGGFWHKKIYPWQMWLDGLYMGSPFYARYASEHGQWDDFTDIANQFMVVDKHTCDPQTGLNYHAWDESKEQAWADKETGCSPHFWSRSIGWYLMAIVDVLDYMPADQPGRQQLIDILNRVCNGLLPFQDKETGMWCQVTNLPDREGNYLESSGTTMFCYAMAKGARMGYLPNSFLETACRTFDGLCEYSTQLNPDGTTSITRACAVAGLGGKPYRSGTFEYYISEPIRNDDPKVVGPFILAALELAKSAEE